MGKFLRTLSVIALLLSSFSSNAQITIGTVDAGPYTPGSTIAATFSLGPACIAKNNTFNLYLSDASGSFANKTLIGSYTGFYSTFVNGLIPITPPPLPGTGYKLRVESTTPGITFTESNTFTIGAGAPVEARLISTTPPISNNPETFGSCNTDESVTSTPFRFTNASTVANVTVTIINELTPGVPTVLTFTSVGAAQVYTATLAHYTMIVRAVMPDATIGASKAYFLINNVARTAFTTTSSNTVCFPTGSFEYLVNVSTADGIGKNFPGNIYHIDWGDGTTTDYTFCDIISNGNKVGHSFTKSSCGLSYMSGIQTVYNAFGVNVNVISPFCGAIGSPLSTPARVVSRPENRLTAPTVACLNDNVIFVNTSLAGEKSNTNSIGCADNTVLYTWYVDGQVVPGAQDQPKNYNLQYIFTVKGTHTIRLTSLSDGGCQADPIEFTICIQDPPQPSFTLPTNTLCVSSPTLTPTNTSIIDNTCPNVAPPVYTWTVTPSAGVTYTNGTANSITPTINFSQIGVYNITLNIQSATCNRTTVAQKVVVNSVPQITMSPEAKLCTQGGNFTFGPTGGPTQTTVSGTAETLGDTYTWSVTGGTTYTFVSPDGPNTQYPVINFSDYGTYTVTLIHKNNCGTETKSQVITFSPSPVPVITVNPTACYNTPISLAGSITNGTYVSYTWSSTGNGTFSIPGDLTTTYTPSAADLTAGSTTITLLVNTGIPGACAQVSDVKTITIFPNNTGTSAQALNLCNGTALNYTPTSTVTGSTFAWTAANADGNADSFTATGAGNITDLITLRNPTVSAVVVYTITPTANGCVGVPFTLTVTVRPVPVLTATPQNAIICNAQSVAIDLTPNLSGTLYTWTSSVTNSIQGNTASGPTPVARTQIADVLTNLSPTDETVTYIITPYSADGCPGDPKTVTVTVKSAGVIANAGPDQFLCNELLGTTLTGNALQGNTGQWAPVPGITFSDPASPTTTVTGLIPGRNYTFTWTINGTNGCPGTSDEMIVYDYNPVTNTISSQSTVVCYGQLITITGDVPTGGNGTYAYTWESSADGTTWDIISGQTGKDLNYTLLGTLSFRRTVISSSCTQLSNVITIIAQPPISNNNIAANQEICSGIVPAPLTGSLPQGSDGNFNYQWQSSTNGTTWTNINVAVFPGYAPPALTVTTYYRRVVSTVTCNGGLASISVPVTITVKPDAKAEFTYNTDRACAPFVITAQNVKAVPYADRNGTYTWFANNVQIGTGLTFPGYTITNSNELVDIKLVVSSSLGCSQAEFTHTFGTIQNVVPAFTQSTAEGCGPLVVNFVNTSASLVNATFRWDFGNGTTSSQVMPGPVTFLPDPTGKDITYTVTLTATNACGVNSVTSTVFVKAKPIAVFSPSKTVGCSPMTVTFSNTSPGGTNTYYYDFGDGTLLTKTDKSDVQHTFTTGAVTDFVVKMRAVNECGTDESSYTIRVAPNTVLPELVVNANEREGCAPFKVNFYNNSKGANSFKYTFGDGSTVLTRSAPEVVAHTFTTPGTYTITLLASNGCSDTTTTETITVLPQPLAAFTADITLGCPGLPVQFKNTTTDGVAYLWDFGDGTTSTEFEPKHTFTGAQEYYTVSLTATNNLGCTYTATRNQYIHIVPPPVAKFNVNPSTLISIPNYTFRFEDESTNNPTIWLWDFGDGTTSALQNPSHTYPDTGSYVVNLRVTNQQGCFTTTFKTVTIVGVPGYLYVPNSFIPGSAFPELREFRAKGSGIKSWKMSIFNKWGQVLWETTKLEEGRPAEGWDGVFQATPVPQGVYFWKIDVEFVNGAAWKGMTYDSSPPKKTGPIHLIR